MRNGPQLASELIRCGAPKALLELALRSVTNLEPAAATADAVARAAAAEPSAGLGPARSALFSLGNLMGHAEIRLEAAGLQFSTALSPFLEHEDGEVRQYAERVLHKIK